MSVNIKEIDSSPRFTVGRPGGVPLLTSPLYNGGRKIAPFTIFFASLLLVCPLAFSQVSLGIDELERSRFEQLQGRRVALITNHTGLNREGESTVDILFNAPYVQLICVLSPEHGFRGTDEHGQNVGDGIDPKTKLPIYSLYGSTNRPTSRMLQNVDTLVFDIQDIGTRFYTYITTMGMALEEAAKRKLRFVVLDRPNPIRGDIIEGDILDPDIRRMTGYFQIPVRHGLTVGELALWMNQTQNLQADLWVIPMRNWKRSDWFDQTGLEFVPPSPNIRSLNAALLYVGVGCFEATNVAVGRGTDTPFEIFGAPWIKSKALVAFLREKNFPGVLFETVEFTPTTDIYAGQLCQGVRLILTDRARVRPLQIFQETFLFLRKAHPQEFKPVWEEVRVVTGSNKLKDAGEERLSDEDLFRHIEENLRFFHEQIFPFYLY
ncbi:MAG: hypothetical protein KCHDKBKB_02596 [Elusimicrobia bacterium]|nr:hypothetical protein [Elusimicrobiota bacterium]